MEEEGARRLRAPDGPSALGLEAEKTWKREQNGRREDRAGRRKGRMPRGKEGKYFLRKEQKRNPNQHCPQTSPAQTKPCSPHRPWGPLREGFQEAQDVKNTPLPLSPRRPAYPLQEGLPLGVQRLHGTVISHRSWGLCRGLYTEPQASQASGRFGTPFQEAAAPPRKTGRHRLWAPVMPD